jgi:hypothetical protein
MQVLQAHSITFRDLIRDFGLEYIQDQDFFPEWRQDLPELSSADQALLDKMKAGFFNLLADPPVMEKPVQFAILGPLLLAADFYLPPFQMKAEKSIEIETEDGEVIVRGCLDALVLRERFWVVVIESKQFGISIEMGLAQLLAYMMANPDRDRPSYGLITNGAHFLFTKLVWSHVPQYANSALLTIRNPGNELYDVLKILKRLGQL